jgi:Ca2+:H+ antiporter
MVTGNNQISGFNEETEQRDILKMSHGTAIILLFSEFCLLPKRFRLEWSIDKSYYIQVYLSYLYFQLFSHKSLYEDNETSKPETVNYTGPSAKERAKKFLKREKLETVREVNEDGVSFHGPMDSNASLAHRDEERQSTMETEGEEDVEVPELSLSTTVGLLVVVTVLVAVTAEWLVDSIDGLASGGGISKEFIGLILLPIVGNAAEHVSAVTVSVKDKLTLSISVAVGSSIVSFPLLFRHSTINSFSSSKSRYLSSHSPSSLGGSWAVRLRCSLTRSSRSCSFCPS